MKMDDNEPLELTSELETALEKMEEDFQKGINWSPPLRGEEAIKYLRTLRNL